MYSAGPILFFPPLLIEWQAAHFLKTFSPVAISPIAINAAISIFSSTVSDVDSVFDNIYDQMIERFEENRARGGRRIAQFNEPDQNFISHDPINEFLGRAVETGRAVNRFRQMSIEDGMPFGEIAEKYGAEKIDRADFSDADIADYADGAGVSFDRMEAVFESGDGFLFEDNVYLDSLDFLKSNEQDIYNQFIDNELVYCTSIFWF